MGKVQWEKFGCEKFGGKSSVGKVRFEKFGGKSSVGKGRFEKFGAKSLVREVGGWVWVGGKVLSSVSECR